jgi:hypothetical protein
MLLINVVTEVISDTCRKTMALTPTVSIFCLACVFFIFIFSNLNSILLETVGQLSHPPAPWKHLV